MSVLVKNVRYRGEIGDILVASRGVTVLGHYDAEIDGTGLVAVPAFEDRHVHFRDPGQTHKEDLLSGARAAAAGGYSRVQCEPNTNPVLDTPLLVREVQERFRIADLPVRTDVKGALTVGQHGTELVDIPAMLDAAVWSNTLSSDGEPVTDHALLVSVLRQVGDEASIHLHCEETPRSAARVSRDMGPGPSMHREPELVRLALAALAEAGTGHVHIQHVSLAETVGLIAEAKSRGLNVTAEVAPHHLVLCEEDIPSNRDANWKMNPPLRSRADMLAMRRALADGVIDYVATDHAPHTPAEKAKPWDEAPFGIIGLETAFGACMSLVHRGELSFDRLMQAMGGASDLLSPNHYGRDAVTLLDLNHTWTVGPSKFYSKSRNCPFAGMTFTGKPMYTIIGGKVVMAEGEVLF